MVHIPARSPLGYVLELCQCCQTGGTRLEVSEFASLQVDRESCSVNARTCLVSVFVIILLMSAASRAMTSEGDDDLCSPLDPPIGDTVTVSTVAELEDAVSDATSGDTILVTAGTYYLSNAIWVVNNGVTIRGATGNRDDVVLDGGGMLTWSNTHVIAIDADDVTIADLTIRNGDEHGISVQGSDRPTLYNLHILDTGYQLVKINPVGDGSEDGLLACSCLEYTTTSPEDYTNGISAHDAHRWTVRDNEWYRIRTPNNEPVPTILFWSGSSDTVVERNLLVDCYQGISFGNSSDDDIPSHTGGVVRNNMIYASLLHDVVVEMVYATDWLVAHNTALLLNPVPYLTYGMEARYSESQGAFAYNLTNMAILPDRDGAQGILTGNVVSAQANWFVDAGTADLHLAALATDAIDQAAALSQVTDDFDGDARPIGSAPDVGADEYRMPAPTLPSLTLVAPIGGEAWPVSSTRQIRWNTSGTVAQVSLAFSSDGFVASQTIASSLINTGVYTWTTPLTPTRSAQVRVSSVVSPTVISDTSGIFILYDPATLTNTIYLPVVLRDYASSPPSVDGTLVQPTDSTRLEDRRINMFVFGRAPP
jgi:hypothetical protein